MTCHCGRCDWRLRDVLPLISEVQCVGCGRLRYPLTVELAQLRQGQKDPSWQMWDRRQKHERNSRKRA